MIVVDASVVATALADDGADGTRARARLSIEPLAAPELIDLEVVSVLRRLAATARLDPQRADQAVADLQALRLERVAHQPLLARAWELRNNVTPYDAAYVALAEALDAVLVTADARLAASPGPSCVFEVLA